MSRPWWLVQPSAATGLVPPIAIWIPLNQVRKVVVIAMVWQALTHLGVVFSVSPWWGSVNLTTIDEVDGSTFDPTTHLTNVGLSILEPYGVLPMRLWLSHFPHWDPVAAYWVDFPILLCKNLVDHCDFPSHQGAHRLFLTSQFCHQTRYNLNQIIQLLHHTRMSLPGYLNSTSQDHRFPMLIWWYWSIIICQVTLRWRQSWRHKTPHFAQWVMNLYQLILILNTSVMEWQPINLYTIPNFSEDFFLSNCTIYIWAPKTVARRRY